MRNPHTENCINFHWLNCLPENITWNLCSSPGISGQANDPTPLRCFFRKEKDKSLKGSVEYRAPNRLTEKNNAPISRTDETFDRLGWAEFFSILDLTYGFHQIRIRAHDIEQTAFNCRYGPNPIHATRCIIFLLFYFREQWE